MFQNYQTLVYFGLFFAIFYFIMVGPKRVLGGGILSFPPLDPLLLYNREETISLTISYTLDFL